MRTFFGLELPVETAMEIADWRDRQFGFTQRPVPPANFHVTLAFIGEATPAALERLCQQVDDCLLRDQLPSEQLLLDNMGYWPKPGIYWLGPRSWPESLTALAGKLRHLAISAGARRDRHAFQPHVTLFRNCSPAPVAPMTAPEFTLPYRHFTLFESRRGKSGVSYHPLQDWELSSPGH